MFRALHISIGLLICSVGLAQSYSSQVVNLFTNNERGIWVKQYEGLADDVNPVALVLGHTDKVYKGIFIEKGLPVYFIEGDMNVDRLQLLVLDSVQSVVGYIQATIADSVISGDWNYVKGDINKRLHLKRTLRISGDVDCGQNKWIKTFTGNFLNDNSHIFLQREDEGELYGLLHLDKKNTTYTLHGQCEKLDCKESSLVLTSAKGVVLGQMNWADIGDKMAQASLDDHSVFLFKEKNQFPILCGSQIVRDVQLTYIFPQLRHPTFNPWLKSKVNDWLKGFEQALQHGQSGILEYQFWVDIDFLGQQLVSGLINFDSPSGDLQRESFIYDLDKKEMVILSDWISRDEEFNSFKKSVIEQEKLRDTKKESPSTQQWFRELEFNHPTMRKEGLCFHSDVSRIYGERLMVIPWELVQPYMKRPGQLLKKLN